MEKTLNREISETFEKRVAELTKKYHKKDLGLQTGELELVIREVYCVGVFDVLRTYNDQLSKNLWNTL